LNLLSFQPPFALSSNYERPALHQGKAPRTALAPRLPCYDRSLLP
jgi:hypothetical protein